MKGVLASRAPGVIVVDVTHGIPAQDVRAGALVLRQAAPWFPAGTIHVAVVDPGVGSSRRAIAIETARSTFVGPDNGILTLAAPPTERQRVVELTNDRYLPSHRSHTFHGRDVFAPMAAALALGVETAALGAPVGDPCELELPAARREADGTLVGEVVYVDGFGNLVSNLSPSDFAGREVSITIGEVPVGSPSTSYASVPPGEPVAVVNSWSLVEIAVRDGSATHALGLGLGALVRVEPA
jgi:S-adenosylmethionine hydrolase